MLSLLLGEEGDEFIPSSASSEAFLVRVVVVLVEVEGLFSKGPPRLESSGEGATAKRKDENRKRRRVCISP